MNTTAHAQKYRTLVESAEKYGASVFSRMTSYVNEISRRRRTPDEEHMGCIRTVFVGHYCRLF